MENENQSMNIFLVYQNDMLWVLEYSMELEIFISLYKTDLKI